MGLKFDGKDLIKGIEISLSCESYPLKYGYCRVWCEFHIANQVHYWQVKDSMLRCGYKTLDHTGVAGMNYRGSWGPLL